MKTKFFTFINPFLTTIDNGSFFRTPFKRLYQLIALLSLVSPLYILTIIIKIMHDPYVTFSQIIFFVLIWILYAIICWFSFQLWWNRADKLEQYYQKGDDFVATPILSHFIQTLGEWLGILIGLFGFIVNLAAVIFLSDTDKEILSNMPFPTFMNGSISSTLGMLILGFLIIVVTRFLAEQSRAIVAIANNTKKEQNIDINKTE